MNPGSGNNHALTGGQRAGGSFYQVSAIESELRELREMAGAHGSR